LKKFFENRITQTVKSLDAKPVHTVTTERPTIPAAGNNNQQQNVQSALSQQSITNLKDRGYSEEEIKNILSTL